MAEVSREQLSQVIDRVLSEVTREAGGYEKEFAVTDLRASVTDLGRAGGESAWEISYKTSSATIESARELARMGGQAAWEISYKTSSGAIERTQKR